MPLSRAKANQFPIASKNIDWSTVTTVDQLTAPTTQIPSGADLNDYTTPGMYLIPSAATMASLSNTPTGVIRGGGILIVRSTSGENANCLSQELIPYLSGYAASWKRGTVDGTFGSSTTTTTKRWGNGNPVDYSSSITATKGTLVSAETSIVVFPSRLAVVNIAINSASSITATKGASVQVATLPSALLPAANRSGSGFINKSNDNIFLAAFIQASTGSVNVRCSTALSSATLDEIRLHFSYVVA